MRKLLIIVFALLTFPLIAHPGKTDANDCHTNKKTGEYHCHGNKAKTPAKKKEQTNFLDVQLVSVYDGDTFKIHLPCTKDVLCQDVSVRVKGIDTPEIKSKKPCEKAAAKKAKQYTTDFLKSGKINLYNCQRDKYFRLLCDVKVNEQDLATKLLAEKLAVKYDGGTKKEWCAQ